MCARAMRNPQRNACSQHTVTRVQAIESMHFLTLCVVWANVLPGLPNHDLETKPLFFNKLLEFRSLATVTARQDCVSCNPDTWIIGYSICELNVAKEKHANAEGKNPNLWMTVFEG